MSRARGARASVDDLRGACRARAPEVGREQADRASGAVERILVPRGIGGEVGKRAHLLDEPPQLDGTVEGIPPPGGTQVTPVQQIAPGTAQAVDRPVFVVAERRPGGRPAQRAADAL